MQVAFFVELFPKLSETFILNQMVGLLGANHDVEIFADRKADERKRHDEVNDYDLIERTNYAGKPTTYGEAIRRIGQICYNYPTIIDEVVRSVIRGESGAARMANLEVFLNRGKFDFDVYHAHFGNVGRNWDFIRTCSSLPLEVREKPFIVSFYGLDASYILKRDPTTYESLFRKVDRITVLSEDMKGDLVEVGCPPDKVVIQPLAVDLSKFRFRTRTEPENRDIRILTVARFDEQKGLKYAVDAIARLVDQYDITYQIAGGGPLFKDIERRVHDQGIQESVELLGWVNHSEVKELYGGADVFLLPSVTAADGSKEGTPTVLLEAQATGLPVVSTFHAGIPEIVDHDKSGYLVPERDVGALADAIETLVEHPERWSQMGRHGRELVEKDHSIPVMVDRLEYLYRSASRSRNRE